MTNQEALKLIKNAGEMTDSEQAILRRERLVKLVEFARQNSSVFKMLYKELPENYSLKDLPYTSKKMLMQDYEGWLTNPTITKADVQKYLAADPITRDEHRNLIHDIMLKLRILREDIIGDLMDIRKHHRRAAITTAQRSVENFAQSYRLLRRKTFRRSLSNVQENFQMPDYQQLLHDGRRRNCLFD